MSKNEDIEIDAEMEGTDEHIEEVPIESGSDGDKGEEVKLEAKKKRMSSKKKRILIVVVIIAIALVVVLWGAAPPDYDTVSEVLKNQGKYVGEDVTVKGKVGNWTGGHNFTMVDDNNASYAIHVVHDGPLPEGFAEEKVIVVDGKLEEGEFGLTIKSTKIQVGCPSKY
ncbi:MAG: cytochrome c maturation protein CcmE [Thermoplasmata archaeon]|nr:MAG: cytochrome c maturation protein CcmE [Thermoplasmata archaeon]